MYGRFKQAVDQNPAFFQVLVPMSDFGQYGFLLCCHAVLNYFAADVFLPPKTAFLPPIHTVASLWLVAISSP